jgi:hypothetical protein
MNVDERRARWMSDVIVIKCSLVLVPFSFSFKFLLFFCMSLSRLSSSFFSHYQDDCSCDSFITYFYSNYINYSLAEFKIKSP